MIAFIIKKETDDSAPQKCVRFAVRFSKPVFALEKGRLFITTCIFAVNFQLEKKVNFKGTRKPARLLLLSISCNLRDAQKGEAELSNSKVFLFLTSKNRLKHRINNLLHSSKSPRKSDKVNKVFTLLSLNITYSIISIISIKIITMLLYSNTTCVYVNNSATEDLSVCCNFVSLFYRPPYFLFI